MFKQQNNYGYNLLQRLSYYNLWLNYPNNHWCCFGTFKPHRTMSTKVREKGIVKQGNEGREFDK